MAGGEWSDKCTELEIALERSGSADASAEPYAAQLRIDRPDSDAEDRLAIQGLVLDRAALRTHALDPVGYGQILTDMLFGPADARAAFSRARAAADRLRIRLSFGPGASDLHDLRWETLRDPDRPGAPLLSDRRILFSRYLSSFDWRPVRLRPRDGRIDALVVVANPRGLTGLGLDPVAVAVELARARDNLVGLHLTAVTSDAPQRASFERVLAALRSGPDILYIVAHGRQDRSGQAAILLEDSDGGPVWVRTSEILQGLLDLEQRPRLVVLAACEGAGTGGVATTADGGALMAIGPRLAEAGVPAVLAMQGRVRMKTVAEFMPAFFRELASDGLIDRAVACGRAAVRDPDEAWRPALFMRLKHGRVWYEAGFGSGDLDNWDGIRLKIDDGESTPILGPNLFEGMFEYRAWLARRWAREFFFPLAPTQREDLTAVAQYLAGKQGPEFPHKKLVKDLPQGLVERGCTAGAPLADMLAELRRLRFAGKPDPYAILAGLPLPVFLLACPDPLLEQALREHGKRPQVAVLPWRRNLGKGEAIREPTVDAPLVYHLFGTLAHPKSLVLTQDDYTDFLLRIHKPEVRAAIPRVVLERLVDSSLLWLGFQVDSWEFRAVFRTIMQEEGIESSRGPHVAAQIDPEEGRVLDGAGARNYFERYLRYAHIDLYWGSAERFLIDLAAHTST